MGCQDVLYSEHTCTIVLMSLFWSFYCPSAPIRPLKPGEDRTRQYSIMRFLVGLYCATAFVVIIGSRFHYTDDVLLGGLICAMSFGIYHCALRAAPFHHGRFWNSLMSFEAESPDMQAWVCCALNTNGGMVSLAD